MKDKVKLDREQALFLDQFAKLYIARREKAERMWTEFLNRTPDQLGSTIAHGNRIFEKLRANELKIIAKETGLMPTDVYAMFSHPDNSLAK